MIERPAPLDIGTWARGADYELYDYRNFDERFEPSTFREWLHSDGLINRHFDRHSAHYKTGQFVLSPEFKQVLDIADLRAGVFATASSHPESRESRNERASELRYFPNDEPDIYQNFLRLDISNARSILRFVRRYGILGFTDPTINSGLEPLAYFRKEWREFSDLAHTYMFLKQKDMNGLREWLLQDLHDRAQQLERPTQILLKQGEESYERWAAKHGSIRSLRWELDLQDPVPALVWKKASDDELYRQFNFNFRRLLNDRLRFIAPAMISTSEQLPDFLVKENRENLVDPRFLGGFSVPRLIDSIYLYFYLDITNPQGILKRCKHCGKPFIAGGLASQAEERKPRNDRVYCSQSCRTAYNTAKSRRKSKVDQGRKNAGKHNQA